MFSIITIIDALLLLLVLHNKRPPPSVHLLLPFFFQVEYILGFGAAVVIVLTIIIILILYLILQCRSRHKRRNRRRRGESGRSATSGGGGNCDSNSESYMERSTVDFIVPGEMELTSAVRSVSNSTVKTGVTDKSKDVGGDHDGNKATHTGGHQPPPAPPHLPPSAAAASAMFWNPMHHPNQFGTIPWRPVFQHQNGFVPAAGHVWPPPHLRPLLPPTYRDPPPPPPQSSGSGQPKGGRPAVMSNQPGSLVHCPCCGEANWNHHAAAAAAAAAAAQFMTPHPFYVPHQQQPQPHPRTTNSQGQHMVMYAPMPDVLGSAAASTPAWTGQHNHQHPHQNQQRHQHKGQNQQQQQRYLQRQDSEDGRYSAYSDGEAERVSRNQGHAHHSKRRPSSSSVSGGDLMGGSYPVVPSRMVPPHPHYVTMSRASLEAAAGLGNRPGGGQLVFQQQKVGVMWGTDASSGSLTKGESRYNSQPFLATAAATPSGGSSTLLGSNILDYGGMSSSRPLYRPPSASSKGPPPIASKSQLDRLNYKSSVVKFSGGGAGTAPAKPSPQPRYQTPVSQQTRRIPNDEYLFPDLPPPPDALLDNGGGDTTTDNSQIGDLQNSRSSSLDDLHQWVNSATDMTMAAVKNKAIFNTLPGQFQHQTRPSSKRENVRLAVNGVKRTPVGGNDSSCAVKVDLSASDKSIRRPDSAPDLVQDGSPHRARQGALKKYHHSHHQSLGRTKNMKRSSSITKKVVFTGVSDGEGSQSEDEESTTVTAEPVSISKAPVRVAPKPQTPPDDIWVLRSSSEENKPKGAANGATAKSDVRDDDNIPVTGVVIAHPQPCQLRYTMPVAASTLQPQTVVSPAFQQQQPQQQPQPQPRSHPPPVPTKPLLPKPPPLASASSAMASSSASSTPPPSTSVGGSVSRPTPPPPPPRTTPVARPQQASASASASSSAASNNPVLQRRPGLQHQAGVNESPDEGYHEDADAGSEAL